jgi:hypothetical protein
MMILDYAKDGSLRDILLNTSVNDWDINFIIYIVSQ